MDRQLAALAVLTGFAGVAGPGCALSHRTAGRDAGELGNNWWGQLGDDTLDHRTTPVELVVP